MVRKGVCDMGSVTISGNDYDIYGTAAAATIYLAARIGSSDWTNASETTQSQALVTATRQIQNFLSAQGFTVDPADEADEDIANATYEYAFALVVDSDIQDKLNQNENIKRQKADTVEIEYFKPTTAGRFPAIVQTFLNKWLSSSGAAAVSAGSAYGTTNESTLAADDYGIDEAY